MQVMKGLIYIFDANELSKRYYCKMYVFKKYGELI